MAAAAPSGGGEKPEEDEKEEDGRKESAEKVKKVSFNNGECVRGETDNGENGRRTLNFFPTNRLTFQHFIIYREPETIGGWHRPYEGRSLLPSLPSPSPAAQQATLQDKILHHEAGRLGQGKQVQQPGKTGEK